VNLAFLFVIWRKVDGKHKSIDDNIVRRNYLGKWLNSVPRVIVIYTGVSAAVFLALLIYMGMLKLELVKYESFEGFQSAEYVAVTIEGAIHLITIGCIVPILTLGYSRYQVFSRNKADVSLKVLLLFMSIVGILTVGVLRLIRD